MRHPRLTLHEGQPGHPIRALAHLADPEVGQISLWGRSDLWVGRSGPLLAFFCSAQVPASRMLAAHDLWPRSGGRGLSPSSAAFTPLQRRRC